LHEGALPLRFYIVEVIEDFLIGFSSEETADEQIGGGFTRTPMGLL
jgi:hypothetical protein